MKISKSYLIKVLKAAFPHKSKVHIKEVAEFVGKQTALLVYKFKDAEGYIHLTEKGGK